MCHPSDYPPYDDSLYASIDELPFCGHGPGYTGHASEEERQECEAGWDRYYAALEEDYEREVARRGKKPPMAWGDKMTQSGEDGYFCLPEWQRGEPTGFHPYSVPPCDPIPPFDAERAYYAGDL